MVTLRNLSPGAIRFALRTARGMFVVSGVFSLAVCVLMIANYAQLVTVAPLDSEALITLRSAYRLNQGGEQLENQIRLLDFMSRRAYFTRSRQLKTGGYLLIAGAALFPPNSPGVRGLWGWTDRPASVRVAALDGMVAKRTRDVTRAAGSGSACSGNASLLKAHGQ